MKKVLELIEGALKALKESGATGARAESIKSHLESCASNARAELPQTEAKGEPKKEGGFASAVLLAVIGLIALALLALSARSETVYQSFGATNYIAGSTTITSFPTNVATTNAAGTIGQRTGAAIFVGNQEHVNFVFMSEPVASDTTNSITFKLIRGYSSSTPTITSNTFGNATFAAFPQWETQPTLTLAAQQQGTNSSCWSTNLAGYIGGASHIGIYSEQNGFSTALTNFDVGLSKKIVPIVYK